MRFRQAALYALLLFAAVGLGGRALATLARLLPGGERAQAPFRLSLDQVTRVDPTAQAGGLREGDRIVAVAGRPFVGRRVLAEKLAEMAPGGVLEVEVARPDGGRQRLDLPTEARATGLSDRVQGLVLAVFLPIFCVALGFHVAFRRPEDLRAWLLLGLLLGFATIFNSDADPAAWPRLLAWPALSSLGLFNALWAPFMLLFGTHFPERLPLDRRHPWLVWLWLAPLVALAPLGGLIEVVSSESFAATRPLLVPGQLLGRLPGILMLGAISGFFALLGYKSFRLPSPDARRRLRLLWFGASVSFTPMFVLVLMGMVRGRDVGQGIPSWILAPALLLMALFPLTLAYTIVVDRALDVGVVIRQGLQYALARNGVFALRVVISMAVIAAAASLAADPAANRPRRLMFMAAGVGLVIQVQRAGEKLKAFTDRRFFREALDTERLLQGLADDVRTIVDTDVLLDTASGRLSDALHAPRVAVFLEREGGYALVQGQGLGSPLPDVVLPAAGAVADRLRAEERPLLVYPDDPRSWLRDLPERDGLRRVQAQALIPLRLKQRLAGFLAPGAQALRGGLRALRPAPAADGRRAGGAGPRARPADGRGGRRGRAPGAGQPRAGDRARGAGAALPAGAAARARARAGRPLPPGPGRGRRLLRLPGAGARPPGPGHRRCLGQGHPGGAADGQPAGLAARPGQLRHARPGRADGARQPAHLRLVQPQPLRDLLLRRVRSGRNAGWRT